MGYKKHSRLVDALIIWTAEQTWIDCRKNMIFCSRESGDTLISPLRQPKYLDDWIDEKLFFRQQVM